METDSNLLNSVRMLDQDALTRVFDLYATPLYRYALRLCGDSFLADQIVGDVFAKLLDQLACGKGPNANLRSYLYETAYHRIIDEARSSRHKLPLEVAVSLQQDVQPGSVSLEDQIIFQQILYAIRTRLTDDQRHVIILRFLEGFSLRETAAIIGKEVGHVKVIQNRGISVLRRFLDQKRTRRTTSSPKRSDQFKTLGI